MAEAARILRPGGRIVVLDLLRHDFEEARELYADVWLGFTEVELDGFLKSAGFSAVTTAVVDRESEQVEVVRQRRTGRVLVGDDHIEFGIGGCSGGHR